MFAQQSSNWIEVSEAPVVEAQQGGGGRPASVAKKMTNARADRARDRPGCCELEGENAPIVIRERG